MRPEVMFNPRLIEVKSYWRFGPPQNKKEYFSEINQVVNKNIATWLKIGAPTQLGVLVPETIKLKDFVQKVYKGSTGSQAPSAPPPSLEEQFMQLLDVGKADQAAKILEEHYEELKDKTFVTPVNRRDDAGIKLNLRELLQKNYFPVVLKIAFEKGFFKGGSDAYEVSVLMNPKNRGNFLYDVSTFQDPARTCQLYLKYYRELKNVDLDVIKEIDAIGNDESVIVMSKPLSDLLGNSHINRILKGIAQLPQNQRQQIVDETLLHLKSTYLKSDKSNRFSMALYIERLLRCVWEMQHLDLEQRNHIWSVATKMKIWEYSLDYMEISPKITWVPDKKDNYSRDLKAPFSVSDVITYAGKTIPDNHKIEFLKSEAGKQLISEIIDKLNEQMVPKNDFASLSSTYNRENPEEGYNKFLIANYVSQLKFGIDEDIW